MSSNLPDGTRSKMAHLGHSTVVVNPGIDSGVDLSIPRSLSTVDDLSSHDHTLRHANASARARCASPVQR